MSECLYSAEQISAALDTMAEAINRHYEKRPEPLLVLVVMKGALVTAGTLLPRLIGPVEVDYVHATRYRDNQAGEELHWYHRPRAALSDRHVLLVDDILDQGVTLAAVHAFCMQAGAMDVKAAVLVEKSRQEPPAIQADFKALVVPDRYIYGFGMDNQELDRNLNGIYAD